MRGILTASLPPEVIAHIRSKAKKKGVSISQLILHLFHLEKDMISEEELLASLKEAEKEHRQGKTRRVHSLRDLMN